MPINITMPALSPTMTEGTLAKWLVKEGDAVEAGDVIAEIETDKATMEVEAVDEGTLGKILVPAGSEGVAVNTPIAVLLEEGESADDISTTAQPTSPSPVVADAPTPSPSREREGRVERAQGEGEKRVFASPLAKRIAKEKGLDLSMLKGSGPRGRIVKKDVELSDSQISRLSDDRKKEVQTPSDRPIIRSSDHPATGVRALAQAYGMDYTEIPANNIKKITAARLQESKASVPHFYLSVDCVLDELMAARKTINDKAEGAYKISVNDFMIKACAMALQAYPAANVAWAEDATLQFVHADISVAVATPNGLITPIVKKAETKGLRAISEEVKDLAARAREGKLKPAEFQGGTFTISNLGMYGIKTFGAILNPPQSCILAVGAGVPTPVVLGGAVQIRNVVSLTLSTDHRTVDGAVGAEFLQVLKRYIEDPMTMLV